MNNTKIILRLVCPLLSLAFIGCTTIRYYPTNFVESLKHPTKFPEVYSSTVKNIEEVAEKNPLGENEETKVTHVGENKNSSMHLVQVRQNGELRPHYHKRHDEVVYVKKGSGIATLDGTRYMVKPGSILQIPAKTVHKFLNTGAEPFVAVSIFSPPFDGRDEKKIKEKRKADRVKKEEKRLAVRKPEKTKMSEEKNDSTAVQPEEAVEDEKPEMKSEKTAHKEVSRAEPEEPEAEDVPEETKARVKESALSKGKKKSKKTAATTEEPEPTIDINDLHKKLTQLLELKEEGTLSPEDYEEKKDALIKGKDIGELPEPKAQVKRAPRVEEEPVAQHAEESTPTDADETAPSEEQEYPQFETPSLSGETAPVTQAVEEVKEVATEEMPPQTDDDKLKMLEEMRQEGLITEEDYENKKSKLTAVSAEETQPALTSPGETSGGEIKDEKANDLKELYEEGLITEEDYKLKLNELSSAQPQDVVPAPVANEPEDDRLSELNELREEGLITEEDYEFKKAQLLGQ